MKQHITKIVIPVVILASGVVAAAGLRYASPAIERSAPTPRRAPVEVLEVQAARSTARVQARGVVQPAKRVRVIPEVSGRVVKQSPALMPGGRFEAGEVLARIDARDYSLAIAQQRGQVEQRRVELELEQGRQEIAAREWQLLGGEGTAADASLALRKPQLVAAESGLEAAKSGLRRAQLSLSRTVLRAPFNAMVVEESVDEGQVVGPGAPIATLIGTDEFWVRVSVPVDKLAMIDVPGVNAAQGSRATVRQRLGAGAEVERAGRVLRLQGELDPETRTAQLLVAVQRPLDHPAGAVPLLPGAYVAVEIEGRPLEQAISVPRQALVDGDSVWVVDAADRLQRRQVELGWRDRDAVVVLSGLAAGERVVTSPLSLPLEGMEVEPLPPTRTAMNEPAAVESAVR